MIRALVLVLGLALGLTLAGITQGRMAHLRALLTLPEWTQPIAADAGVLRGHATGPGGYVLRWRLARPDWRGPVWALWIEGPGTRIDLEAVLARTGLALGAAQGTGALQGPVLAGRFEVTGGAGSVTAQGLRLDLDGRGTALVRDGATLPEAAARLSLFPGGWRLAIGGDGRQGTALHELTGD